ncbi:MAG: isocitrate/isopropylmalate family dehydrogenase, partial [Candidatus Omnitrophica bacterium]|nr:isocitrate/isopropylmalate family dehydrogenase [Candidatus Omnitrophota bacterium]
MKYRITLIPGDGIGPEVIEAARRCIEATGIDIEWDEVIVGSQAEKLFGTPLPQDVIESIRRNKVALKGPVITPIAGGYRSVNVSLRQKLDLYACVRPAKLYPGIRSPFRDVDIVVIRENTEDLYIGIEFENNSKEAKELINFISKLTKKNIREDSSLSIKPISTFASERIIRFAFEYAIKFKRKKLTVV